MHAHALMYTCTHLITGNAIRSLSVKKVKSKHTLNVDEQCVVCVCVCMCVVLEDKTSLD